MKFKYKKGDIINYRTREEKAYIIKNISHDKNNYYYYTLDVLIGDNLIHPYIDIRLLEDNTELSKYFLREKKLKRLKIL